jgi:hypothetical protein
MLPEEESGGGLAEEGVGEPGGFRDELSVEELELDFGFLDRRFRRRGFPLPRRSRGLGPGCGAWARSIKAASRYGSRSRNARDVDFCGTPPRS